MGDPPTIAAKDLASVLRGAVSALRMTEGLAPELDRPSADLEIDDEHERVRVSGNRTADAVRSLTEPLRATR